MVALIENLAGFGDVRWVRLEGELRCLAGLDDRAVQVVLAVDDVDEVAVAAREDLKVLRREQGRFWRLQRRRGGGRKVRSSVMRGGAPMSPRKSWPASERVSARIRKVWPT